MYSVALGGLLCAMMMTCDWLVQTFSCVYIYCDFNAGLDVMFTVDLEEHYRMLLIYISLSDGGVVGSAIFWICGSYPH
jgi:hypothetical protein